MFPKIVERLLTSLILSFADKKEKLFIGFNK